MKFSKLILAISAVITLSSISDASARTVYPLMDKRGNPVQDSRGNCARTKWLADQCCDVCGYNTPEPEAPAPVAPVCENKVVPYIDLIRQSIYFVIDKDNIDNIDDQRINDVINEINKSKAIQDVKLVGYADRFNTNKYNIDLSKRRATNVLNNFRNKGYLNNITVGFGFFGEEKPVTNCPMNVPVSEQVACLQADRRVDIEVEVQRERVENSCGASAATAAAPAYPRPGTDGVEVYSRPVNLNTAAPINAPVIMPDNTPYETPAVPVAPVQVAPTWSAR